MRNRKRSPASPIAFILVLMLLFSLFTPVAYAAEGTDVTDNLTEQEVTLKQDDKILTTSDKIDSEKELSVEISFRVPVIGDEPTPANPVNAGDTARFEVSDKFALMASSTGSKELKFGTITVGHLTLVSGTGSEAGKVFAEVQFDGDELLFDGSDPTLNTVKCQFTANLKYDKTGDDGTEKDVTVSILEKNFTVHVAEAPVEYTVVKSGTVNLAERQVEWNVTVGAVKAGNPIDLEGYKFVDDLSKVGSYVADTFAVSGIVSPTPDYTGSILSYIFPKGSTSPKNISFVTKIPEDKYYGSGEQSIMNKAVLKDSSDVLKKDALGTVQFTPPKWIEKTGLPSDTGGSTYIPTGRTIAWTITANHEGASLKNVVITDVLNPGLTWVSAKWEEETAPDTWAEIKTFPSTPVDGKYEIGDINRKGRLLLITSVADDTNGTTTITKYTNKASISWDGSPGSDGLTTGDIGVNIGYNAITKTGTVNVKDRTVKWTLKVDAKGQSSLDNLKVYDLLVYGNSTSGFDKATATGWPAGINTSDITNIRYDQKYNGNFTNIGPTLVSAPTVHTIMQDGKPVADLLVFTGLSGTQVNEFTFDTLVLNPDIFASNTSKQIYNTAMLFNGTTKLTEVTANPSYNSRVLAKEMLKREAHNDPADGVNNITTTASDGFHYIDKSVIFRLSVNANGLNWTGADINAVGDKLGSAIATDTLPADWEFVEILPGKDFLIFEGIPNTTGTLQASGTALANVTGLTPVFEKGINPQTATFTFSTLDKPYVILVKAKPKADKIEDYFDTNKITTEENSLGLKAENWQPGVSVKRAVSIVNKVLDKTNALLEAGQVKWTVEYKSYDLTKNGERRIEDKLPMGLELRTDNAGTLLVNGNITANEMLLKADGTYQIGTPVALNLGDNLSYDNETRILTFKIPDSSKAYRLTYITDVTGIVGTVLNHVKLIGSSGDVEATGTDYAISEQDGFATLQRNGWLEITKTDGSSLPLAGAEFTLYAQDGKTVIRKGTTGIDGKLILKVIPDGTYLLKETKAPVGYSLEGVIHTITVTTVSTTVSSSIDGKTGANSNKLSVIDFADNTVGNLTIQKIVAGNANENRAFEFIIEFFNADGSMNINSYQYINKDGLLSGVIQSGDRFYLKDSDAITINGLPKDLKYVVTEKDYSSDGYTTTHTGEKGIIDTNKTHTAVFTNTKKNSNGGGSGGSDGGKTTTPGGVTTPGSITTPEAILGSLKIIKVDGENPSQALSGATFELIDESKNLIQTSKLTDKNGVVIFEQLELGVEYSLREKFAPAGYKKSSKEYSFQLTDQAGKRDVTVQFKNYKIESGEISQIDPEEVPAGWIIDEDVPMGPADLDDTPKTGVSLISINFIIFLAVLSVIGLILTEVLRRRKLQS
ncbi:MSCRAMM family protein [Anaerovorax odorimutans]|uniref:MSCRAMM family protein n=1 Tax=Anaerovorax odorimutans TaxID=109327 RepID=UPI00042791B2|nr:SpaA isopeptide-forming pilin-related protein [Anaerovorax odorimutans]